MKALKIVALQFYLRMTHFVHRNTAEICQSHCVLNSPLKTSLHNAALKLLYDFIEFIFS